MVLNLNITIKTRPKRIKHYAIIHNGICKGYKWRYKDEKYNSIKPKIKLDICLPPINK